MIRSLYIKDGDPLSHSELGPSHLYWLQAFQVGNCRNLIVAYGNLFFLTCIGSGGSKISRKELPHPYRCVALSYSNIWALSFPDRNCRNLFGAQLFSFSLVLAPSFPDSHGRNLSLRNFFPSHLYRLQAFQIGISATFSLRSFYLSYMYWLHLSP